MITLGLLLSLGCAFVANLAFFFKHRGANAAPKVDVRHPFRTTKELWSSKWFAIGMAIAACAWILHVAALAVAPITVVQMGLAAGVVMIGVMADRLFGVTVGRRQWVGLALVTVGLVVVALTFPGGGEGAHSSFNSSTMAVFQGVLFAIGGLFILGPRIGAPESHYGVMLGAAAGVLFGVSAIAIKALTGIAASEGIAALVISPWLAFAVAASVGAFFSSARGLQEGQAVAVIAITGVATNITTIASGVIVFGDPMPGTTLGIVVHGAALLLIVVAAAMTPTPTGARTPAAATA
jgi:drug/metabolite transporter (DMT)-like permease